MTEWSDEQGIDEVERVLMLRAVARFSDDCDAPELTPECPFYEIGADGPVCAEQCQDLVAKFPDDLMPQGDLGLGVGLTARRSRRTRRGPSPDERAFDAGEIRMNDRSRPLDEQRLTALLSTLKALVSRDPLTRNVDLEALLAEIKHRGVEIEVAARLGLSEEFLHRVLLALWSTNPGVGLPPALIASLQTTGENWRSVLQDAGGLREAGVGVGLNTTGAALLRAWFQRTDPLDTLGGRIPDADELLRADDDSEEVSDELVGDAEWMFDRFTLTYPAEWREGSLAREWRFINTQRVGCCPPGLMRQRMVDELDVARALADEQCNRHEAQTSEPPWLQLKGQAFTAALEGRLELAADIFGVVAELDPTDVEVMNNLGFCRIPSSPADAISALEKARGRTSTPMLTALNLGLALHLAGDSRAPGVAEAALREDLGELASTYVWGIKTGTLELEIADDLLLYGEELVLHMSQCAGACVPPLLDSVAASSS